MNEEKRNAFDEFSFAALSAGYHRAWRIKCNGVLAIAAGI